MASFSLRSKKRGGGGVRSGGLSGGVRGGVFSGRSVGRKEEEEEEEEDEEEVENALAREAAAKRLKAERERVEMLAAENPSVFDYDDAFDEIQKQRQSAKKSGSGPQKAKFIDALKEKAAERQKTNERVLERKIQREQEAEAHLYEDKEKFVTGAYKKKLEERRQEEEEERRREKADEAKEVTGKKDLSGFYYNLMNRNEVMGADSRKKHGKEGPGRGTEEVKGSNRESELVEPLQGGNESADGDVRAAREEKGERPVNNEKRGEESSSNVAAEGGGNESRTRTDTAKTVPTQERKETPHERAVRLNQRRNDDTAIEAARQRYFVRVSARKLMQEGHGRKRVGT